MEQIQFKSKRKPRHNIYLAYYSHNKEIVAYSEDKQLLENYLFKNNIYDKITIFETDDQRFIEAIHFEFWHLRLIRSEYSDGSLLVCTDEEYEYICKHKREVSSKLYTILNDLSFVLQSMDLEEDELKKIFKASKILSKHNRGAMKNTISKDKFDNKTLRKLVELEKEIKGDYRNFDDFYHRYHIIII